MKLKALTVHNLRGYSGDVKVELADITALVGKNDVGKSSLLDALAIFFGSPMAKLEPADQCVYATDCEVRIGCVFTDLPATLVLDSSSQTTLRDEYLLNRDGDLEIHKVYHCDNGRLSKESVVAVAMHPTAAKCDDLLLLKNAELKKRAEDLRVDLASIDKRSDASIRRAVWSSVRDLGLGESQIPLNKEEAKRIWDGLSAYLPSLALFRADRPSTDEDSEVQDPMRWAVQQAMMEVAPEIERIKERVRLRALEVAERTLAKVRELDESLARQLAPTFKSEPKWDSIFKLALTGDDEIPLNKRGSGVRRLVLLSFFQAEAERRRQSDGRSNIILAVEEPETSLHPNNQRLLIEALIRLANQDGCQVVVTTHVPSLAGLIPIEGLRYIERRGDNSRSVHKGTRDILARVAHDLGVLPDKRVKVIVCVEGPRDVTFIKAVAKILRQDEPSLPDLENDPRIVVIPLGGSTLKDWVNEQYLKNFGLPEVHIYDRDSSPPKYNKQYTEVNARQDGSVAFLTRKRECENYLHRSAILESLGVDVMVDDENDVPLAVARSLHAANGSSVLWDELEDTEKDKRQSRAKVRLSNETLPKLTVKMLEEREAKEEVLTWLRSVAEQIT